VRRKKEKRRWWSKTGRGKPSGRIEKAEEGDWRGEGAIIGGLIFGVVGAQLLAWGYKIGEGRPRAGSRAGHSIR